MKFNFKDGDMISDISLGSILDDKGEIPDRFPMPMSITGTFPYKKNGIKNITLAENDFDEFIQNSSEEDPIVITREHGNEKEGGYGTIDEPYKEIYRKQKLLMGMAEPNTDGKYLIKEKKYLWLSIVFDPIIKKIKFAGLTIKPIAKTPTIQNMLKKFKQTQLSGNDNFNLIYLSENEIPNKNGGEEMTEKEINEMKQKVELAEKQVKELGDKNTKLSEDHKALKAENDEFIKLAEEKKKDKKDPEKEDVKLSEEYKELKDDNVQLSKIVNGLSKSLADEKLVKLAEKYKTTPADNGKLRSPAFVDRIVALSKGSVKPIDLICLSEGDKNPLEEIEKTLSAIPGEVPFKKKSNQEDDELGADKFLSEYEVELSKDNIPKDEFNRLSNLYPINT